MPTTSGGLRYPASTDAVDVPGDMKKLADDVDTYKAPVANPTFTGVASFPQGSGSAPAITRTGDTDTGIHFPGENLVAIATGGSERVRINTNGLSVGGSATERIQVNSESSGGWRSVISGASAFTRFFFDRSRGTNASPTVVSDGDSVGDLVFRAHDGTTYVDIALVRVAVDGAPGASDMPGRIQFHTTVDGTTSLTERMRIDNAGLITGTGTSLGAWTAYTPTLGGTGWDIGNGTAAGAYCQIGKIVVFRARIIFGSTSTAGAGAAPTITIPVTSAGAGSVWPLIGRLLDASTGSVYLAAWQPTSTTVCQLNTIGTTGLQGQINSTTPFTWTTSDELMLTGVYQAS